MPQLNIQAFNQYAYDPGIPVLGNLLKFVAVEFSGQPFKVYIYVFGASNDPSASPYPTFIDNAAALAYYGPLAGTYLMGIVNTTMGASYYTTYDVEEIAPPVGAALEMYVPEVRTVNGHALDTDIVIDYSDLSGNPSFAAVATSGSYNDLSNKPTIPTVNTPSFTNPSRSLNTSFQISTTQNTVVSYSVDISCSMSLITGQKGTLFLRYADDSAFTTNVVTVARGSNSNSGTLTLGLALTQIGAVNLYGMIPAGKYVKLITQNDTGTPTFTIQNSQEVLI